MYEYCSTEPFLVLYCTRITGRSLWDTDIYSQCLRVSSIWSGAITMKGEEDCGPLIIRVWFNVRGFLRDDALSLAGLTAFHVSTRRRSATCPEPFLIEDSYRASLFMRIGDALEGISTKIRFSRTYCVEQTLKLRGFPVHSGPAA